MKNAFVYVAAGFTVAVAYSFIQYLAKKIRAKRRMAKIANLFREH